jgi:hypothetical protein
VYVYVVYVKYIYVVYVVIALVSVGEMYSYSLLLLHSPAHLGGDRAGLFEAVDLEVVTTVLAFAVLPFARLLVPMRRSVFPHSV